MAAKKHQNLAAENEAGTYDVISIQRRCNYTDSITQQCSVEMHTISQTTRS